MKYLLDTNICVFLIRRQSAFIREHLQRQQVGDVGISAITESELLVGANNTTEFQRVPGLAVVDWTQP